MTILWENSRLLPLVRTVNPYKENCFFCSFLQLFIRKTGLKTLKIAFFAVKLPLTAFQSGKIFHTVVTWAIPVAVFVSNRFLTLIFQMTQFVALENRNTRPKKQFLLYDTCRGFEFSCSELLFLTNIPLYGGKSGICQNFS